MMARPRRGTTATLYTTYRGTRYAVAGLRSVGVSTALGDLPAANPIAYDADYSVPGLFSWDASASGLLLLGDTPGERATSMRLLMSAQRRRQFVPVEIEYPDGVVERGTAIPSGIERRASHDGLIEGSYSLKGVGPLEEVRQTAALSGGEGTTETTYELGIFPGTVRLDYQAFQAQDAFEILYASEVVATTGGPVSGQGTLEWEYPAAEGQPTEITVRISAPNSGTAWEYVLTYP